MKRISVYVQHLFKFDAQALVLASGQPVVARFPTGDRSSKDPLDHGMLVNMIQEAAPPPCIAELRGGKTTRFDYDETGQAVSVEVAPSPGSWKVTISRKGAEMTSTSHTVVSSPGAVAPGAVPAQSAASTGQTAIHRMPGATVAASPAASGSTHHGKVELGGEFGPPGMDRWLKLMTSKGCSDLHLSTGMPPLVRLHGEITKLEDFGPFTHEMLKEFIYSIMPEKNKEEFDKMWDTDWAYEIPGLARYRANAFMDRRGIGGVFRRIPFEILSAEKLGIPKEVLDLCNLTKGLVVVTGPTGSGKSTTLATLVDVINSNRDDHIITIEDPIEFVHENKKCLVNQREVRVHTHGFKNALRAALREDPDIVLVGEMRDLETIAIAIETAETGHLVFGTLHTNTAPSTVDRIIDQFPSDRQAQVRTMLSESLKGVIAQVLCKKKGGGRCAAYEILIGTPAVANLIREGKTFQIPGVMQTSRNIGMRTMNDSIMELMKKGLVEYKEGYMKAINKAEMRNLMNAQGFEIPTYT